MAQRHPARPLRRTRSAARGHKPAVSQDLPGSAAQGPRCTQQLVAAIAVLRRDRYRAGAGIGASSGRRSGSMTMLAHHEPYRQIMALALAIAAVADGPLAAENWPAWRGPNTSGVSGEMGLPETWSETHGVLWKAALPGAGISNPIVWDGHVFVTCSDGPKQDELHLICLARDGG